MRSTGCCRDESHDSGEASSSEDPDYEDEAYDLRLVCEQFLGVLHQHSGMVSDCCVVADKDMAWLEGTAWPMEDGSSMGVVSSAYCIEQGWAYWMQQVGDVLGSISGLLM